MRNHTIAIQGSLSSFHDLAAKKHFGNDITLVECNSFKDVCKQISENQVDYGIIAIENKIAGSILLNYQLIEEYDLNIIGEIYLPIELYLFAYPDTQLNEIKEIISHPMALAQCQNFLSEQKQINAKEYRDTATSAKIVSNEKNKHLGVIAGPQIGKEYNLTKIGENISDEKLNYTRFYILSKGREVIQNANKASIIIQLKNQIGVLSDVLSVFKHNSINLLKIQSLPSNNHTDIFSFHLDLTFNDRIQLDNSMKEINELIQLKKILGIYKGEDLINYN